MSVSTALARAPSRPLKLQAMLLGLGLTLWLGLAAARGDYWDEPTRIGQPRVVKVDPAKVRVLDGDTLKIDGASVRFLGVDTPERSAPWFRGDQEPWASRASAAVRDAVQGAKRIEIHTHGRRDLYGRELVHIFADGESLGLLLVRSGLAYPTVQRYGDGGFPKLSERLLREATPPKFERPWEWRRTHRIPVPN